MRRLSSGLAALIIVGSGAAQAQAQGDPPSMRPSLFISPNGQPFRAKAGEPYPVARWFAQVDSNGDGKIDRTEFRADAASFFRALDTNRDGVIDGFEIQNYEHNVVPEILGAFRVAEGAEGSIVGMRHGPPIGGGASPRPRGRGKPKKDYSGDGDGSDVVMGGAVPYELLPEPEPVSAADTNLNGRVNLADFLAAADRRFNRLDSKGQGYLTLDGLPKTPVQQAAEDRAAAAAKGAR